MTRAPGMIVIQSAGPTLAREGSPGIKWAVLTDVEGATFDGVS